jgi:hypothetical protein
MSKILYDTVEQKLCPYPRNDDELVTGLDPRYTALDVIHEDAPTLNEGERARPTQAINLEAHTLTHGWQVETLPKFWPSSQAFVAAFTDEEKAAIALSTNAQVAAMRLTLNTWHDTMHPDDPRVSGGLALLVSLGILTEQRKSEVIATATSF